LRVVIERRQLTEQNDQHVLCQIGGIGRAETCALTPAKQQRRVKLYESAPRGLIVALADTFQ